MTTDVLPARLRAGLVTSTFARRIYYLDDTDSTNRVAAELARQGERHGTVILADHQSAGRGRQGRTWYSPPGRDLLFSIILKPGASPGEVLPVTLLLSAGLCAALAKVVAAGSFTVKWPNDILAGDRKICGLLSESSTRGNRVAYAVVGVGVNVNSSNADWPEEVRGRATSCAEIAGQRFDRAELFAQIMHELEAAYDLFAAHGFAGGRSWYLSFCRMPGRQVRYESEGRTWTGVVETVAEDGGLVVKLAGAGRRVLYDPEVHLLV